MNTAQVGVMVYTGQNVKMVFRQSFWALKLMIQVYGWYKKETTPMARCGF